MATTTNTGAKKIDQNEQWRNILGIHNDTVDAYDEHITSQNQAIGNLSNLTTTEKGSLVGAANELNSNLTNCNIYMMVSQVTNASEATIGTQSGRKFKFPGCFIVGALLTSDNRYLATSVIGITDFKLGNDNFVRYITDDGTKITFHFQYVSETSVKAYISNASGHFGRVMMFSFGTPET